MFTAEPRHIFVCTGNCLCITPFYTRVLAFTQNFTLCIYVFQYQRHSLTKKDQHPDGVVKFKGNFICWKVMCCNGYNNRSSGRFMSALQGCDMQRTQPAAVGNEPKDPAGQHQVSDSTLQDLSRMQVVCRLMPCVDSCCVVQEPGFWRA